MLVRRHFILGCGSILGLLTGGRNPPVASDVLLDRAIGRLGRASLLNRVRTIAWEGSAVVHAGGREIQLGVSTRVAPFRWAHSTSWLAAQGPAQSRVMHIDRDGGWSIRQGAFERLPEALVRHERAQFAIYGMMLLAPLRAPAWRLSNPTRRDALTSMTVTGPSAPETTLSFDRNFRLAEATNLVPGPDGGEPIPQRFTFSAEEARGPIRWPRHLSLMQRGEPYFDLTTDSITVA